MWALHPGPAVVLLLGARMEVGCGRREQREASPLPGRAGRGSEWGDTAHCGCCNSRSSAAPPRRAATRQSWRWCCPPCCGRFQRPPPASCTLPGQLVLLLPEHLWMAKRRREDETGFAAVTSLLQPPLLGEKDPTQLSHTHMFLLFLPALQLPPCCTLWRSPQ